MIGFHRDGVFTPWSKEQTDIVREALVEKLTRLHAQMQLVERAYSPEHPDVIRAHREFDPVAHMLRDVVAA